MTALGLAGGATSAGAGLYDAHQAQQQGKLQAAGAGVSAAEALATSAQQQLALTRQRRLIEGMAIAQTGANGLNYGGSALDVLGDISAQGALQVANVRAAGNASAMSYGIQRSDALWSGHAGATQAGIGAIGSLLSGAAYTMQLKQAILPKQHLTPYRLGTPKNPLFD